MHFSSLTLLGSTGSIGRQTLDVLRNFRSEIRLAGISAGGGNVELFCEQIVEFQPPMAHLHDVDSAARAIDLLRGKWAGRILTGAAGLSEIASEAEADLVLIATVGWAGLEPALTAIARGRHIAIANKEALVCGGHLIMPAAAEAGVLVLPVDSEHNAIFQCLAASPNDKPRRLVLTCSGGPFRECTTAQIDRATAEETLRHPTWNMGNKITVDSATLMNKGFEVIEAHHLFGVPYDQIEVVIHPQSTIHSMVEFVDGSIIAQLGRTDMRMPIQYALTYPERRDATAPPLDLAALSSLTFAPPDLEKFPCLAMAYEAGRTGGSAPCVLNAANEIAVRAHLDGEITCGAIPKLLQRVMEEHTPQQNPDLNSLREWDQWGRAKAKERVMGDG